MGIVAVLLAVLGIVIVWTSQSDSNEPGDVAADSVNDFCSLVDVSSLSELALVEDERVDNGDPDATPPRFICEITLMSDEETGNYTVVTLIVDVRVEASLGAAREAYAGAIDFEESEGRSVSETGTTGDEAAFVTVAQTDETQQYRVHLRDSNAVGFVSLVVSGAVMEADDARHVLITVGQGTLAVMGSE